MACFGIISLSNYLKVQRRKSICMTVLPIGKPYFSFDVLHGISFAVPKTKHDARTLRAYEQRCTAAADCQTSV